MFCKICNQELTDNNWLKCRRIRNHRICKFCIRKNNNNRYSNNKEKYLLFYKNKRKLIKEEIFNYYGGKCNLCGENDFNKLSIDHINHNGRKHRRELNIDSGSAFYKWILKHKPNDLRLLCYNCNCAHDMIKKELLIVNLFYKENNKCKYCFSNLEIKFGICNKCRYILKKNKLISLKEKIYKEYGEYCKNCGCSNYSFLTIDHINNDGAKHRKEIGSYIYSWLLKNSFPKDNFQILCYNCNYIKRTI